MILDKRAELLRIANALKSEANSDESIDWEAVIDAKVDLEELVEAVTKDDVPSLRNRA